MGLRREFSFIFTVANISKPIIGADFLAKFGILIDIKNRKLIDPLTNFSVNAIEALSNISLPKLFLVDNNYMNRNRWSSSFFKTTKIRYNKI